MTNSFYDKHIFLCINKRDKDSRCSCGNNNAEMLAEYMKDQCKKNNLKNIRVNKSLCLNRCELGPVMVIYPDAIWYRYSSKADIDQIINEHLINNKIAMKLILN